MPLVKVSLLKGKSKEEKKALLDAIHSALIEAFQIPENDRNQRINEPQLDNWGVRGGVPASAIDLGFKIDV